MGWSGCRGLCAARRPGMIRHPASPRSHRLYGPGMPPVCPRSGLPAGAAAEELPSAPSPGRRAPVTGRTASSHPILRFPHRWSPDSELPRCPCSWERRGMSGGVHGVHMKTPCAGRCAGRLPLPRSSGKSSRSRHGGVHIVSRPCPALPTTAVLGIALVALGAAASARRQPGDRDGQGRLSAPPGGCAALVISPVSAPTGLLVGGTDRSVRTAAVGLARCPAPLTI